MEHVEAGAEIARRARSDDAGTLHDARGAWRAAGRIAAAYALVAGSWIVASDYVVVGSVTARPLGVPLETIKGLVFVLVTTLLLAAVLGREFLRRARIERALRESEQRFRAALDASPIAVFTQDRDLRYTWIENQLQGLSLGPILGRTDSELLGSEQGEAMAAVKGEVLRTGRPLRVQREVDMQGDRRTYDLSIRPSLDEDGQVSGIVCAAVDISPIMRAEEARRAAEAERDRIARLQEAILDAVPARIALVDHAGALLAANRAWRASEASRGAGAPPIGDLRLLCPVSGTQAADGASAPLHAAADGLRAVLDGRRDHYDSEYACPQPDGDRWFRLLVRSVSRESNARAVVMHVDETDRWRAEESARDDAAVAAALAAVGRELLGAFVSPELPTALCRVTRAVLECEWSRTYLRDPESGGYAAVGSSGTSEAEREAARLLRVPETVFVEGLAGATAVQRVVELPAELRAFVPTRSIAPQRMLFVALRRGDELIGVHVAARAVERPAFSRREERIARGIAQLASMALQTFRLLERLEQANRLKSDFVATMSHELRTPLNVILGYVALALDEEFGTLAPDLEDALRRVHRHGHQLFRLVEDTLDLSRLESGRVPVAFAPVSVSAALGELRAEIVEQTRNGAVRYGTHVDPDADRLVTDEAKLKVILRNLIVNACKYTPKGEVAVRAEPDGDGIRIAVRDTGIGIPATDLDLIFEPFRQLDAAGGQGGVGLGLYLTRRLVEACRGRVDVRSTPGAGSVFSVWLPRTPGP